MADIIISSLEGGQNEDPPISIDDDQVVVARNVEFIHSRLGERRLGSTAIDLVGSPVENCDRIVWMHRHEPTNDPADAQFWVLGITDPSTAILAYKDTSWHEVTVSDAFTIDGVSEYQVQGQSLHGKLFIAYNSAVDRLHVWDGTNLRKTGLAEPAAPTGADTVVAGSFTGVRYYRVRYTVQSGGVTLRRSEPSTALTFTPNGSFTGATITKPISIGESETHWELEASVDNANFYVIATTAVGTTTVTDTQDYDTGYAQDFELSEDIGDYELIPSVKLLTVDQDRLVAGSSFEDDDLASRVMWTPVNGDPGVGNDERIPIDTDNFLDLDGFEGGPLTGLSSNVNGYIYATKFSHIYQLARSGVRTQAYEAIPLTKNRGALRGSLVSALNNLGNPTFFCLDPDIGPCVIGPRGVEPCGKDLSQTWDTVNLDASKVTSVGLYYPENQQIHWWIATNDSDTPNLRILLHTEQMRESMDGMRRGWVVWDGPSSNALAACLFSDNIDDDTDRSNVLVPFIALEGEGLIWRTNTGNDDNGTDYSARILSKPYVRGNLLHQFSVMVGMLLAKAQTDATLDITIVGSRANLSQIEKEITSVSLTSSSEGDRVIRKFDNLSMAELNTVQVEFEDPASPGEQWSLELFAFADVIGQRS